MSSFALIVLVVAAVVLSAIVVHGRIAGQAMRRARTEDVPQVLEISSRALTGILGSMRMRLRQALPGSGTATAAETVPAEPHGTAPVEAVSDPSAGEEVAP